MCLIVLPRLHESFQLAFYDLSDINTQSFKVNSLEYPIMLSMCLQCNNLARRERVCLVRLAWKSIIRSWTGLLTYTPRLSYYKSILDNFYQESQMWLASWTTPSLAASLGTVSKIPWSQSSEIFFTSPLTPSPLSEVKFRPTFGFILWW